MSQDRVTQILDLVSIGLFYAGVVGCAVVLLWLAFRKK